MEIDEKTKLKCIVIYFTIHQLPGGSENVLLLGISSPQASQMCSNTLVFLLKGILTLIFVLYFQRSSSGEGLDETEILRCSPE